ncbi:MAG: hypothetical protein JF586_01155 [Burkholderiales bacterium]|nr:hypothetical protein [Burkholderiales bacterium]
MHPPILVSGARTGRLVLAVAGLLASALALAAPRPPPGIARNCPARATLLVEHFIGADCVDCWQVAPPGLGAMPVGPREWSLDWLAPTADDAPMAPGALPEAAERLARVNAELPARVASTPSAFDSVTALSPATAKRRFYVHSSLPHDGYMGVQMHATGVWPAGSTGWIALVELIDPGVRGTQIPRRLVRVLVGPVKLPAGPGARNAVAPLYGLRWPENAHAENLVATAWVEDATGRITQVATDRCADPR